jgi:hypothetical protein
MARHDIDPVLRQLAPAINESGQAAVPIMVSVRGTVLNGAVISEQRYFSELVAGNPLMSALEPSSGLLGKDYAKDAEVSAGICTCERLVTGARVRSPRACGASAWRPSTAGPCARAAKRATRTAARSPACLATRRRGHDQGSGREGHTKGWLYEPSDWSMLWASSQMCPPGSVKLAVRMPHGRSTGPLSSLTP